MKKLVNNIVLFRKLHGYTQEDLASYLSVSKNTVSAWETGMFSPSSYNIYKMLVLFDTDYEHLMICCSSAEREEIYREMNKHERKELKNMKLMVEGFREIAKICEPTILDFPFPEVAIQERYDMILEILQFVNDNLK